jgi:uncharacterized protein YkwD
MKRVLSLLAAAALLCGQFVLPAVAGPADTAGCAGEMLRLVTAGRARAGLAALGGTDALGAAAQKRAEEIAVRFGHTRPGGRDSFTVFGDYGIEAVHRGENLASGYDAPADAMDGWMKSSGHRQNILGDFDKMGVGVTAKNGKVYWVQLFIREGAGKAPAWKSWPPAAQVFARVVLFGWIWMD